MSDIEPVNAAIAGGAERRCNIMRENALLTLVLSSVVRATQALAGDQPSNVDSALKHEPHDLRALQSAATRPFVSVNPLANDAFSATEFRPRRPGVMDLDSPRSGTFIIEAPMLKNMSVWQHMADYKSQGRVRLLTLWQTGGSSLSLQAGKGGAPSLQWSTPWMHHEGASRGVFDHLLAEPARAAANNLRSSISRPTGATAQAKPLGTSSGGNIK
ncbi:MAG: hypothetical protein QOD95_1678 [Gammaproteobacteria bacterium]|nr:hypothetical protein [Gammaproteobacteria bacterium]